MKKLFSLLFFLSALTQLNAQEWTKNITRSDPNFYEMQKAFNEYYETHISSWEADDDYKAFKRWESFMEPRVYPTGEFANANATWEALNYLKQNSNKTTGTAAATASWSALGPQFTSAGLAGIGRVDCIKFAPTNTATVWIGTAGGGLWKSINSGNNWTDMSTNLPNLSVADIAIHPTKPDTMFIATGDGFGYAVGSIFWGGTYSTGVMKSTDGGLTWIQTPLSYTVSQKHIVNRLLIHPNNPDTLLAIGTDGINRSVNGGTTWTKVKSGRFYDIDFNAFNPDIVYAVRDSVFYSINGGATWTVMPTSPKFSGRVAIETTPAKDSVIYVMDQTKKCMKSLDGGTTWTSITITGLTLYGYYDNILSVSPINYNEVYAAGNNMVKTTNGGTTWTSVATSGIHVDHHVVEYVPGTSTIYGGNDGGIYRSTNGGTAWTNFTSGLQITQFYRIGSAATNSNVIYGGAQDNGTNRYVSGTWASVGGGDGMECLVDYTNSNIVYTSSQNGVFSRSTNGGASFSSISTGGGAWTSPMVMDPTVNTTLYFGGKEVRKSVNSGGTFTDISTNLTGSVNIVALAVAKSNANYIYAAKSNGIYVTTNGGTSWTTINAGLPLGTNAITYICISGSNPATAWVTLSGYTAGQKVYKTTNAGATWTNVSGTLPNIPANCIVYDDNSLNDGVYLGTDLGVYYMDNTSGGWSAFSTGLPNVMVYELEINYLGNTLIAATYGRGIWQTPLPVVITTGVKKIESASTISLYPNPNNGVFNLDVNSTKGSTAVNIEVYSLLGDKVFSLRDDSAISQHYQIDLSKYSAGVYIVNINTGFESKTERIVINK